MNEPYAFTFIIALAGIVNGLGIVRWLTAFAEFLKDRESLSVTHSWTFNLFASYQFLTHILLWWSFWGVRDATTFNFLIYLYLLTGPILLYLGTSLLVPRIKNETINLKTHYFDVRLPFWTIFILLWLWAILVWPLLRGEFAPTTPIFFINLLIALVLRFSAHAKIHFVMGILSWVIFVTFIVVFSMELGGVAKSMQ